MNFMYFILLAGLIVALIGIGAAYSSYQTKKRREAFAAMATELGLAYSPTDTSGLLTELGGFELFKQGRARQISNVITAEAGGIQLSIFDYQYTTGSGKHQHTHHQSIVAVRAQQLRLPTVYLRPEHLFDALANLFGSRDIDFPANREFSRAFKLLSDNETATRRLFRPAVLDFFAARQGTYLEAARDRFIFFRRSRRIEPKNIKDFLSEGFEIQALFAAESEEGNAPVNSSSGPDARS